jgi:microcystin-dependent protein
MIQVIVQKNLIGLEDLLIGVGTVTQERGPGPTEVEITKINGANLPYDANFSMSEKFDALQLQIDNLPEVVDEGGNLLTGLINTSALDLDLAGRIWRKTIDANNVEIYYGTELMFIYDPTAGNLVIPPDTDYIAADAVVTAAFEAADAAIISDLDDLDAATSAVQLLDVGTSANNLVQLDGSARLPAVDGSQLTGLDTGVPVGAVIGVPYSTPDSGWLECDGSEISRTTYATLYAKIGDTYGAGDESTTFNLPDYRGEFLRGWDNSRGIDAGRAIGDNQSGALESHNHSVGTLATSTAGNHSHTLTGGLSGSGNAGAQGSAATGQFSSTSTAGNHTHTITGATASSGSSETRPRNVSLMYQIKVL